MIEACQHLQYNVFLFTQKKKRSYKQVESILTCTNWILFSFKVIMIKKKKKMKLSRLLSFIAAWYYLIPSRFCYEIRRQCWEKVKMDRVRSSVTENVLGFCEAPCNNFTLFGKYIGSCQRSLWITSHYHHLISVHPRVIKSKNL